jgi:hypothetical protein
MFREHAIRILTARWVLVGALSLSVAAGWGSFSVSSHSAREMERQLRGELVSLQEAQGKLHSERSKMRAALSEMAQLRTDLTATRTEVARLSQLVGQAKPELPPVRPETREGARTNPAIDAVSKTGSIMTKSSKPLPVKAALGDVTLTGNTALYSSTKNCVSKKISDLDCAKSDLDGLLNAYTQLM